MQPFLIQLYSGVIELAEAYEGWAGPSGLDWYLAAGTYLISFYSDDSTYDFAYMGSKTGSVPNRLPELFADRGSSLLDSTPVDDGWLWYQTLNLGVKIEGVETSVPEPATMVLLGLGLLGLAGVRRIDKFN